MFSYIWCHAIVPEKHPESGKIRIVSGSGSGALGLTEFISMHTKKKAFKLSKIFIGHEFGQTPDPKPCLVGCLPFVILINCSY